MIGKILWQSIKELVECDKEVANITEEIAQAKKNLTSLESQITSLTKHLADNDNQRKQCKKTIDFYELQAQSLHEAEVAKRKQLDHVKNQKEYKALEQEIAVIATQRTDLDELMLRTYHQTDLDNTKIAQENEKTKEKSEHLSHDIENKKNLIVLLQEKLAHAQTKRTELAVKIPTDWLSRYERMRHSVANPIVPVLGECCSVCFYAILYQDMAKLKKSGLLPCRNCYRLLYYDAEEEQDSKVASF